MFKLYCFLNKLGTYRILFLRVVVLFLFSKQDPVNEVYISQIFLEGPSGEDWCFHR